MEIKCPYSINYAKPCYSNLEYLRLCDQKTFLKNSHKYYTQFMLQMAVAGATKNCFFVWTPHGMIINVKNIMSIFFLGLLSMGRVMPLSRYFTLWYQTFEA